VVVGLRRLLVPLVKSHAVIEVFACDNLQLLPLGIARLYLAIEVDNPLHQHLCVLVIAVHPLIHSYPLFLGRVCFRSSRKNIILVFVVPLVYHEPETLMRENNYRSIPTCRLKNASERPILIYYIGCF
jgi:hypothetical protein